MLEAELASVEQLLETGWSERRRGNHVAALTAFEAAVALDPSRSGIKVELAYQLRLLDRLEEAEAVLTALLEAEPNNVGALIERAHLLRRGHDHSGAAAYFQTAVSLSPRNIPLRLELVRELQAVDQLKEAEEELSKLHRIDPGNVAASIERGHVRRRRGDHVGAAMAFGAAVAADAENLDIRLEFARELRAADCLDEAEAVLRALLGADPKRAGALVERAYLSRQRGDRTRAVADFEAAANAIAPDDAHAVDISLQFARELRDHRRFDDAFGVIQSVLEKHPDHLSARLQHGEILRELGDRAKALESFRFIVGRNPDHVPALVGLAREYGFAGSSRAALAMLNRALLHAPDDFAALLAAAEQALASDDAETALRLSREAIARHPDQLAPYLLGARAAAQFDRAIAEELLDQARAIFGPVGDVGAMQIHVLRTHRDYDAAHAVIAGSGELANIHSGLWREATSLAIATGDFESAENALAAPPETATIGAASVHALRGQLAQARRDHTQAIKHYREALACDSTSREWRVELAQCHLLLADMEEARAQLCASMAGGVAGNVVNDLVGNISQHYLGPLFDEFALDRPLLARMKLMRALPPNEQVDPLSALVGQYPHHTGPALLLLLAMRQANILNEAVQESSPPSDRDMPKRIIQYWHDKEPPTDVRVLMSSWRRMNPEYEYRLFDNEAALEFLRTRARSGAAEAFRRAVDIPQRADILRLAYLADEGGFFVDADDRCLASLDEHLSASATFVGYQEYLGSLGANFIGAARRHPVILSALSLALESVNRGDHDTAWLSTGPGLLTRAFAQTLLKPGSKEWRPQAIVLESHALHRIVGVHCPANYKSRRRGSDFTDNRDERRAFVAAGADR